MKLFLLLSGSKSTEAFALLAPVEVFTQLQVALIWGMALAFVAYRLVHACRTFTHENALSKFVPVIISLGIYLYMLGIPGVSAYKETNNTVQKILAEKVSCDHKNVDPNKTIIAKKNFA